MNRQEAMRVVIAPVVLVVALLALVILTGIASQNPDGFEWAVFDFGGIPTPEETFSGIWNFLAEGPFTDLLTGAIGIIAVLALAGGLFWVTSRKSR